MQQKPNFCMKYKKCRNNSQLLILLDFDLTTFFQCSLRSKCVKYHLESEHHNENASVVINKRVCSTQEMYPEIHLML